MFNFNLFFNSNINETFQIKLHSKYNEADIILIKYLLKVYRENGDITIKFVKYAPFYSVGVVREVEIKGKKTVFEDIIVLYDLLKDFTFHNNMPKTRSYILENKLQLNKKYKIKKVLKKIVPKIYKRRK